MKTGMCLKWTYADAIDKRKEVGLKQAIAPALAKSMFLWEDDFFAEHGISLKARLDDENTLSMQNIAELVAWIATIRPKIGHYAKWSEIFDLLVAAVKNNEPIAVSYI